MTEKEKKKLLFKEAGVETENDKRKFRNWVANDRNPVLQNIIQIALDAMECEELLLRIKERKQ